MRFLTTTALALLLATALAAQSGSVGAEAGFAAPVALTSGGAPISDLMYPSPVLRDVDGDGVRELILGEIFGTISVCEPEGDDLTWSKRKLMEAEGETLKLNNW